MGLVLAILLAIFVLEQPWSWVAVALGAAWEVGETVILFRWSQRSRPAVGTETLLGRQADVVSECRPDGLVRVAGELWRARCPAGADIGQAVVVRGLDGLTLTVDPV